MNLQEALLVINDRSTKLHIDMQLLDAAKLLAAVAWVRLAQPEPLRWEEELDNDDCSIWTANSPYSDDDVPFKWRLVPGMSRNRIIWLADHDAELGGEGNQWESLDDAMRAIQRKHDTIVREEKLAAEPEPDANVCD